MKFFRLYSLLIVLCLCCCSASATEGTLILVNAKVWTENPAQPVAEAVALDGARILAVRDNAAIRKFSGPDTRIIDLGGRLLLPCFNDAHVHFLMGGGSLISVRLGTANSHAEFKEGVAAFAKTLPVDPGQRITVAQAVHAYTMGSAFAEHQEKIKGSIEPGKLADLVVLSDIFTIPPEAIERTKVDLTIFDGKIIYQR